MKVILFGGATEGRTLSRELAALGVEVTVCVATDYGREEQGNFPGITVLTGRLDADGMADILRDAAVCIDATHPYAVQATANIRAAAGRVGIPYHRLLRPSSALPEGSVVVNSAEEAAKYLVQAEGNILLTTGTKELPAFSGLDSACLYPRVLPTEESLVVCDAAGIPKRNIIAMRGPFSKELNLALLRQFDIRFLVTKDGGAAGGFGEKADAAAEAGVKLLVIRRPVEEGYDYDDILRYCKELLA